MIIIKPRTVEQTSIRYFTSVKQHIEFVDYATIFYVNNL